MSSAFAGIAFAAMLVAALAAVHVGLVAVVTVLRCALTFLPAPALGPLA